VKNKLSFEITNQNVNNKLILTLNTDSTKAQDLFLFVEKNDSVWNPCDDMVLSDDNVKFYIYLNKYEVGDILTSFEIRSSSNLFPWQTNEGVTVLIDNEEVDTIHTNEYTTKFSDSGNHTIQMVYKGNNQLNMSYTTVYPFTVTQPEVQEDIPLPTTGEYKLRFVDKSKKTFTYGSNETFQLQLTKGNAPVPNRTVEVIKSTGGLPFSPMTNSKGLITVPIKNWDAGKWKVGGYFRADAKNVCSTYMWIEIKKLATTVTMNTGSFSKNDSVKFTFKAGNTALANTKVQLYVNGKAKDYTTSKNGTISFKMTAKKTYKFKAVYKGDKNHSSGELETTITITE
jgi:hypothetical protein